MRFDPDRHHRTTTRLSNHPYTHGLYFITICSFERQQLFSTVSDGLVEPTDCGYIVDAEWRRLQSTRSFVHLDTYVIMPDHVHALMEICLHQRNVHTEPGEPVIKRHFALPISQSLPSLIRQFKSRATKRINALRRTSGVPVWQTGYYDHVVRNQYDAERIRQYIMDNPLRWKRHNNR